MPCINLFTSANCWRGYRKEKVILAYVIGLWVIKSNFFSACEVHSRNSTILRPKSNSTKCAKQRPMFKEETHLLLITAKCCIVQRWSQKPPHSIKAWFRKIWEANIQDKLSFPIKASLCPKHNSHFSEQWLPLKFFIDRRGKNG